MVKAGDVLIELDPTANAADRDHLRSDLLAEQLNVARLRTALAGGDDPLADFSPPADADPTLIAVQRQLLLNQVGEHRAKVAAIGRQQAQKEAEQATTAATIHKLETVIPVIQPRVDMRRTLMEKDLGSRIAYLETLQLLVEQQKELGVQKSHLQEADAAIAAIRETRRQAEAEYRRTLSDELAKSEQKAIGLAQELIKAEQKTRLQLLTAPVDGMVQQLAIHTVGGVVTPAQALLVVVPSDSRLEIEALVPNRDIGFIHPGQEAEIKVDTFNFTRYGLLAGRGAERLAGRHHPRPPAGPRRRPRAGDAKRHQRAQGPGAELQRPHFTRPQPDADRRPAGQPVAGHGGDGGDQDGLAPDPELSPVAAAALPAGNVAREVKSPVRL